MRRPDQPRLRRLISHTKWSTVLALTVAAAALTAPASPGVAQDSRNVTLLSHFNPRPNSTYSSCWSYVHSDGREYAVLGIYEGVSIVRLTAPTNPVEVAFINLRDSGWHEARQYGDHIYVTTEVFNGVPATVGLEIIDMSDPDHPQKVANYDSNIAWAHTIEIDTDRGILYANGANGGLHIYSLADPESPTEIGIYPDYVHDLHIRGNLGYASLIFHGVERILDLTNPAAPVLIKEFASPLFETHSAWTAEDGRTLYVADELIGFNVTAYDITDLNAPRQVWRHEAFPDEIAHNPRVRGNIAFISHYTRGVRLWDISNPAWPVEFAHFDFSPYPYGGIHGNWEVAPYYPSGIFVASSIEDGLRVFRVTDGHAIVRGTVRDAMGNPVPGATVSQTPNGPSTRSMSDGRYALAIDSPGVITIEATAFAYQRRTQVLSVQLGDDRTSDFSLSLTPAGTLRGIVTRSGGGMPLEGAELNLTGTPLRTVTNAEGRYVLAGVPEGTYQVRCVAPGHGSRVQSISVRRSKESVLDFGLAPASFYDGFDTDLGWTVGGRSDDATTGIWLRAAPAEAGICTPGSEQVTQPAVDHTPDPGSSCLVTGNGTIPCFFGQASVRDGQTTVTSPAIPVGGLSDPRIGFWRWYVNRVTSFTGDDPLVCQLSSDGGNTWTTVENLYTTRAEWEYVEIRVLQYLAAPGAIQIRWIASERNDFSIVEALIDDVSVFEGPGGPALAKHMGGVLGVARIGAPSPSPTRGSISLSLELAASTRVEAAVYDVSGRRVATLHRGIMAAGRREVGWDGKHRDGSSVAAGVYFVTIRAGDLETRKKFVIVR